MHSDRWVKWTLAPVLVLLSTGIAAAADAPNIFELALDLAVWTIVVFLLLMFILKKFAWKPLLEGLQKREEGILNDLAEAKKAKEEAERVRAELQKELGKASEKIREMMDEARRDAQHTTEEMIAKARTEIQTERDRLRREMETARDQALQDIWNQTARLATQVSTKAIRRSLSEDDHRRLVDEALSEMKGSMAAARGNGANN